MIDTADLDHLRAQRLLADQRRIIALRTNMNLGQTVRFLDWRDGQMRNGKVVAMKERRSPCMRNAARVEAALCSRGTAACDGTADGGSGTAEAATGHSLVQ
ncbi:hypothetical protein [Variovorax boronicumulans]